PPAALVRRIEPASRDTLRVRWSRERSFVIDGAADYTRSASGARASVALDFDLPGPSVLSPALPVESGRRLAGRIVLDGSGLETDPLVAASIMLRPEGWIDSVAAHGFVDGEEYGIDSSLVALRGLRVRAAGRVTPDSLALDGAYELTTGILDFVPDSAPVDSLRVEGSFVASGTPSSPDVRVTLSGFARGPSFAVDSLTGNAERSGDSLIAALRFGSGSRVGDVSLDRATVGWRGPFTAPGLPGRVTLDAQGPDLRTSLSASIDRDGPLLIVRGDSLGVAHLGRTLGTRRAFEIRLDPQSERLTVVDLDLAGSMGAIRIDGFATPDSADLTAHASLALPEGFAPDLPAGTAPDRIELDVTARGPERLTLTARADGLDLGPKQNVTARLELEGSETGIVARIDAGDDANGPGDPGPGNLLTLETRLPIRTRVFPPALTPFDGPVDVALRFDELPVPLPARRGEQTAWAEAGGAFTIAGSASSPAFEGSTSVTFASLPNLADHRVLVEANSLENGGLEARVDVRQSGRPVAEATLRDPTRIRLYPFEVTRDSTGTLLLDAKTQELRLEDYARWFPAGSSAEGDVRFELSAEGPVGNPALSGTFRTKQLSIKTADRSQIRGRGELRLSGTRRVPRVRGDVTIDRGVLRIPEDPQNLLPAEGDAVLWEIPEYAARAGADSAAAIVPNGPAAVRPSLDPDVEIGLSIPSGLWIRGQGLDVELSGDLSLGYREGAPVVTGELDATRGTFVLLGRTFRMESGSIVFYGDKELNPALDIRLAINLEGTLVRLAVGGTLLEPELALTSEPPMPEGDIMSFLLFGRPLEELNNNQVDLVQRRATDIATVFGTGKLEAKLADQLGVDLVRIRSTSGDSGGTSLVLGKYVSRKVLLEYEQAIESSVFFISLDYILSRHFRIRTLYGQSDQSGMEVNWFNEY
ncbi:MAG: translocation/assembly module TamB, partial [Gemmatimonadetes bacterium]|nr:translocation/assembly module TamB [Gemmatimonadota bacterium]